MVIHPAASDTSSATPTSLWRSDRYTARRQRSATEQGTRGRPRQLSGPSSNATCPDTTATTSVVDVVSATPSLICRNRWLSNLHRISFAVQATRWHAEWLWHCAPIITECLRGAGGSRSINAHYRSGEPHSRRRDEPPSEWISKF